MEGNNQPPRTVRKCRLPGHRAGTPRRLEQIPGRSGRQAALWRSGRALFETSENGLDYFTSVPARFHRRTGNGVLRRITTCLAAMNFTACSGLPEPYAAAVHQTQPADAAKLGVNAGTRVSFSYDGTRSRCRLKSPKG